MTDTYRIVGLAGRGAVVPAPADDDGDPHVEDDGHHEPFLADLTLRAREEIDLAAAATAAAEALAHPYARLLDRAESVAQAVRDAVTVESVEVTLHRPEVVLGVPVLEVEVTIRRPAEADAPAPSPPSEEAAPEALPAPAPLDVPALAVPALAPVDEVPTVLPAADLDATTVRTVPPAPVAEPEPEPDGDDPLDDAVQQDEPDPHVTATPVPARRPTNEAPLPALLVLSGRGSSAQNELASAVRALSAAAGLDVTGVSPLARTAAGGGELHTAVVAASTTLGPGDLAETAALVAAGRTGVDVEILAVGDLVGVHDGVELPLPEVASSATVLVPWSHLDPSAVLPGLGGGPVVVLAETAPDRASVRWLALDWLE